MTQYAITALKKTNFQVVLPLIKVFIIRRTPKTDLKPQTIFPENTKISTKKMAKYFPSSQGIKGSNECNLPTASHNGKYKNPTRNKCLNRVSF
jgi:hypothetical protein